MFRNRFDKLFEDPEIRRASFFGDWLNTAQSTFDTPQQRPLGHRQALCGQQLVETLDGFTWKPAPACTKATAGGLTQDYHRTAKIAR